MLDDARFTSEFEGARARLVRAAARLLGGCAEAEDAVQDTYLRALEAGAPAAPLDVTQAWLTTVMQNIAIDALRRRQWMQRWLAGADAPAGDAASAESDAALAEATEQALRRLAERLSAADGALVLLREVFELSFAELAEASGKSEAACRQQLHRALLRLRDVKDDAAPEEPDAHAAFYVFQQALEERTPQALLALLRQPPVHAVQVSACHATRRPRICSFPLRGKVGMGARGLRRFAA